MKDKEINPVDIMKAGQLAVKLTQGFNLVGEPEIIGSSLVIKDNDDNPKFIIHTNGSKIVEFAYSENIRSILVAGAVKYIEDAGFQCVHQIKEKKHPLESLLRGIKEKIGDDVEMIAISETDEDSNLTEKKH